MNNELCLLCTGNDKIRLPHSDIGDDNKRPSGRSVLIKRTWVPTHLPDDADESRRERFDNDNDDDDNYYYRKNCIRRFRRGRSGGWKRGGVQAYDSGNDKNSEYDVIIITKLFIYIIVFGKPSVRSDNII